MNRSKKILKITAIMLVILLLTGVFAAGAEAEGEETVRVLLGDVDLDGEITSADARIALRISSRLMIIPEKCGEEYCELPFDDRVVLHWNAADIDEDREITAADARKILRISSRLESGYEPEYIDIPVYKIEYKEGVFTEAGYESEYLGLRYTPSEGIEIFPPNEPGDDAGDPFLKAFYTFEMGAGGENTGSFMIMTRLISFGCKSQEELKEDLINSMAELDESYSIKVEITEEEIAGQSYIKLRYITEIMMDFPTVFYYKILGNRQISIWVMFDKDEQLEKLMSGFSAY